MKKLLALLMALSLVVFTGCSGDSKDKDKKDKKEKSGKTDKTGTDKTGTDKTGTDKTGTDKTGTDKTAPKAKTATGKLKSIDKDKKSFVVTDSDKKDWTFEGDAGGAKVGDEVKVTFTEKEGKNIASKVEKKE